MARVGRFPAVEAAVLQAALDQEGITAQLSGLDRAGLQGALPQSETFVDVEVDAAHLARAQKLVAAHFVEASDGRERRCDACGQTSPASFARCWSCEAELTAAPSVPAPPPARAPASRPPVFAILFGLSTLVLAGLLWHERQRPTWVDSPHLTFRAVGACVVTLHEGRRLQRTCDVNGDGNFEEIETYDRAERLVDRFLDVDENGLQEQVDAFDARGELVHRARDVDQDGRAELIEDYDAKGQLVSRSFDDDEDGRIDRVEPR